MPSRKQFVVFVTIIQSILFLGHWTLYETWTFSSGSRPTLAMKLVLGILSVSFIGSSLLAFRYTNALVRAVYKTAAIWLGLLSFLFLAAIGSWVVFGLTSVVGLQIQFHHLVDVLFGVALTVGIYGLLNASCTRITRATVRLANLPE